MTPIPTQAEDLVRETVLDGLAAAYEQGCLAVQEHYRPDPDPEFGEAARDYAAAKVSEIICLISGCEQGEQGKCFECGHDLHAPFCPACNPEMVGEAQPIGAVGEAEAAGSAPDEPPSVLPSDGAEEIEAKLADWIAHRDDHLGPGDLIRQAASTLSRLRGERDEALGEIKALEWIVEDSLQRTELFRNAVAGIDRDFQSSEKHHPDDILIPVERFKLLRDAVQVDEEWGLPKPSRAEAARLKAEDLNRKLVEGLRALLGLLDSIEERSGPPLPVSIGEWDSAIDPARSLLSSIEGGE